MDAPDLAKIAAVEMRANGLEPVFAPEALREAEQRAQAGPQRSGDIRDLTGRQWFSIDNVETLDLDQLTWAEVLLDGRLRLAVAVADVDAMVHRGGSVDAHAAANTTSVYTAAGVFPMLPPLLSNDRTLPVADLQHRDVLGHRHATTTEVPAALVLLRTRGVPGCGPAAGRTPGHRRDLGRRVRFELTVLASRRAWG